MFIVSETEVPLPPPATVASKLFHVAYTALSVIIWHLSKQNKPIIKIHLIGTVHWFAVDLSRTNWKFTRTFTKRQNFHPSLYNDQS